MRTDDLAAVPIAALRERNPDLDVSRIDDVIYGCANQAGEDNRNVGRMALLLAGLPQEIPGSTVNRLCGSSLDAVIQAARAIGSGEMSLVIAGGVESMSRAPFVLGKADAAVRPRHEARRYDSRLAIREPEAATGLRYRCHAGDGRARRQRVARGARRPGRVCLSQPAARGRGRRPPRGRDRAGRHRAAEGHGERLGRRAPARRYHARGARPAQAGGQAGRHGDRRQRVWHQRRRVRARPRLRSRGQGTQADASRTLRRRSSGGRGTARDGHRAGARDSEGARARRP